MNKALCPKTNEPCEMAGWVADHLKAQYVVPKAIIEAAVPFILMSVMSCEGVVDDCQPAGPETLDLAVRNYNTVLREAKAGESI